MGPNDILICIIVLEIIFILCFSHKSELLKEKLDGILPSYISLRSIDKLSVRMRLIGIFILFISLYASHYVSHVIQTHYKINYALTMMFIWLTIMIYLEYILSSSRQFSTTSDDIQTALDRARTGDFIFVRSYHSLDIIDFVFYRLSLSIFNSNPCFSHASMIIKINGIAYILETSEYTYHCIHANKMKSGVKLINVYDFINKYGSCRVYLSRNNLHNYIQDENINKFMDKYGHLSFYEHSVACTSILYLFLSFANVLKTPDKITMVFNNFNFNNPELYTCDFKNIENVELKGDYYYNNLQNKN